MVVVAEGLLRRWLEEALEHSGPAVPAAAAAAANIDSMPRSFDTLHMLHMGLGSHHNIAHTAQHNPNQLQGKHSCQGGLRCLVELTCGLMTGHCHNWTHNSRFVAHIRHRDLMAFAAGDRSRPSEVDSL